MENSKISLTKLIALFDKEASQKRLNSSAFRKHWRKWFKNLLAHILKSVFPTVDTEKTVLALEAHCHGKDASLPRAHLARICGHGCALFEFYAERLSSISDENKIKIAQLTAANPNTKATAIIDLFTSDLNFQERAEFQKEFGFAYGETFTPLGELKGKTDATEIYFQTLVWSMVWLATRFPKTKKEAFQWIILQRQYPLLPRLEEIKRSEREQDEFKRYLQIWRRLGWNLGGKFQTPRKIV